MKKRVFSKITVLFLLLTVMAAAMITGAASYSVQAAAAYNVPSDAVLNNGHYYKLYDVGFTWEQAEKYCENLGGHLATITSKAEQTVIEQLLNKGQRNSYWLGGYGKLKEWKWVTGEAFTYSNWGGGSADNYMGQEDRMMIYRVKNPKNSAGSFGKWNDLNGNGTCNGESFFGTEHFGLICEWEATSSKTPIATAEVTLSKSVFTYNGSAQKPTVKKVVLNGKTLKKGTDYNVTYAGGSSIGKAYVYVNGIGNYTGKVTKTYTIKLATPSISVSSKNNGQAVLTSSKIKGAKNYQFVAVNTATKASSSKLTTSEKLTWNGLSAGKSYTFKVRAYTKISGTTYYSDYSAVKTVKIYQGKDINKTTITMEGEKQGRLYSYTGTAQKPAITIKDGITTLKKDTDYTLTYKNNVNAGTATITITGKGKYSGTATKKFVIGRVSISAGEIGLSAASYTYSGAAFKPTVTVIKNKKGLTNGKDYSVAYKNNVNAGTATVTVTGIGNYAGSTSKTFTIKQRSITTTAVTVTEEMQYTGSALVPEVKLTYNNKTISSDNYTVTCKNNVNIGTATVTITGKKNLSGTLTKNFKITEAYYWPVGGNGGTWSSASDYPRYSNGNPHTGTDIAAPYATPIRSSYAGTVISTIEKRDPKTGKFISYGRYVVVESVVNGKRVRIYYAHMSAFGNIKEGQEISAGTVIGYVGSTGNSTGNHLHFEVREQNASGGFSHVNPTPYLKLEAKGK